LRSQKCAEKLTEHCFQNGLIVWPNTAHVNSQDGDLIVLGPPLISTQSELEELCNSLKNCIFSFFKSL